MSTLASIHDLEEKRKWEIDGMTVNTTNYREELLLKNILLLLSNKKVYIKWIFGYTRVKRKRFLYSNFILSQID